MLPAPVASERLASLKALSCAAVLKVPTRFDSLTEVFGHLPAQNSTDALRVTSEFERSLSVAVCPFIHT